MLALSFNRLHGDRNARFHDILHPSDTPGDANTQSLSVQSLTKIVEGQVPYHKSLRLSLNLPAGPLPMAHVAAVVRPKISSPAGYHYRLVKAVKVVRNTVCRLLGSDTPPRPRTQERPTTTPTRWYCHKCNSGPYNIATQFGCTNVIDGGQCDHTRCSYCKEE